MHVKRTAPRHEGQVLFARGVAQDLVLDGLWKPDILCSSAYDLEWGMGSVSGSIDGGVIAEIRRTIIVTRTATTITMTGTSILTSFVQKRTGCCAGPIVVTLDTCG
jgi:hypothetical protein